MNARATTLGALLLSGVLAAYGVTELRSAQGTPPVPEPVQVGFEAVNVYIDSGDTPLAAYQFELSARDGSIRVVGVENGEHAAFARPPFYDRGAVDQGDAERVIVAAFSTADAADLPTGRTRVATVHVQTIAPAGTDVTYDVTLEAAADAGGAKFQPTLTIEKGNRP